MGIVDVRRYPMLAYLAAELGARAITTPPRSLGSWTAELAASTVEGTVGVATTRTTALVANGATETDALERLEAFAATICRGGDRRNQGGTVEREALRVSRYVDPVDWGGL